MQQCSSFELNFFLSLVLVLLLPVYKVWRLQMPQTRRIVVICIFLFGGLVSVVGIIRIHFLTQILSILDDSPEADTTCTSFPKNEKSKSKRKCRQIIAY